MALTIEQWKQKQVESRPPVFSIDLDLDFDRTCLFWHMYQLIIVINQVSFYVVNISLCFIESSEAIITNPYQCDNDGR